jgi:hypothetical protein
MNRALMQLEQACVGRQHGSQPLVIDLHTRETRDFARRPGPAQQSTGEELFSFHGMRPKQWKMHALSMLKRSRLKLDATVRSASKGRL